MAPIKPSTTFIQQLPKTLSIREMMAEAAKAGHELSYGRVYQLRAEKNLGYAPGASGPQAKTNGGGKKTVKTKTVKKIVLPGVSISDEARQAIMHVITRYGTVQTRAVLDEVEPPKPKA